MNNITHIFFDNDGVLVDTESLFVEANIVAYEPYLKRPYTLADFQEYLSISNKGSKQFLRDQGIAEEHWAAIFEKRNALWTEKVNSQDIYLKGVKELIPLLAQKYTLCIVTSNVREFFEISHKDKDFLDNFDKIFTAEDCKAVKPDPEAYLKAFEYYGVKPENSLIVEDAPRGVVAGKASGARVVAIRNRINANLDISQADFVIESMGELEGGLSLFLM